MNKLFTLLLVVCVLGCTEQIQDMPRSDNSSLSVLHLRLIASELLSKNIALDLYNQDASNRLNGSISAGDIYLEAATLNDALDKQRKANQNLLEVLSSLQGIDHD
jgi:hypothetical protein